MQKKLGTSRPSLCLRVFPLPRGKGRRRDQQKSAVMATCRICWSPLAVDPKKGHPFCKKTRNIKTFSMFTCFSRSRGGREGGGTSRSLQSWRLAEFAGAPLPSTPRRGTHFAKKLGTSRPSLCLRVFPAPEGEGKEEGPAEVCSHGDLQTLLEPPCRRPQEGPPILQKN